MVHISKIFGATSKTFMLHNEIIIRLYFFFSFVFLSGILHGQTTFLNRPSKTESAIVLQKGVLQFESVYEITQTKASEEKETEIIFPGILVRYGFGWGIELRFANQYETLKDNLGVVHGFSDIEIGIKTKVLKSNTSKTEVALASSLFLPTGSNGISNNHLGNETLLIVWHELSENLGIEYNIGYSNLEINSKKGDFIYSFVFDYEIDTKIAAFIETYGEFIQLKAIETSIDFGLAYQFNNNLELELAAGTGINHKMALALIGISWRFGKQYD